MRRLRMSWNTEGGRLVCRWIEFKERESGHRGSPSFGTFTDALLAMLCGKNE